MSGQALFYELSSEADKDLDSIFDYTEAEQGLEQAVHYVGQFETAFARLIKHPELGRERPEIRAELRSLMQVSHVIFYRLLPDRIRIVRLLHGSRDLPKFFE
ncbi:MAG: type II toxin-antitoxin system RelE/ParE family toxin [Pseudomonadales bacterium]